MSGSMSRLLLRCISAQYPKFVSIDVYKRQAVSYILYYTFKVVAEEWYYVNYDNDGSSITFTATNYRI